VDSDIVSEPAYSGGERLLRYGVSARDRTVRQAEFRLRRRASLLAILLLSLGLWAGVWAAVSFLAGVWLR
jgi:hypothetical protein